MKKNGKKKPLAEKEKIPTLAEINKILDNIAKSQSEANERQKQADDRFNKLDQYFKYLGERQERTSQNIDKFGRETRQSIDKFGRETRQSIGKSGRETRQSIGKSGRETRQSIGKSGRETRQSIDKSGRETRQSIDKSGRETRQSIDRLGQEMTRNINKLSGDWGNQWGDFVETLVSGNLEKILKKWGVSIKNIRINRNMSFCTVSHPYLEWEFDIIVINSTDIFVIEVKSKMSKAKIDHFIHQLQSFLNVRDDFLGKKVYAAIAYLDIKKGEKENEIIQYAVSQGLYVIQAVGDAAKSIKLPQNFKPKIFNPVPK